MMPPSPLPRPCPGVTGQRPHAKPKVLLRPVLVPAPSTVNKCQDSWEESQCPQFLWKAWSLPSGTPTPLTRLSKSQRHEGARRGCGPACGGPPTSPHTCVSSRLSGFCSPLQSPRKKRSFRKPGGRPEGQTGTVCWGDPECPKRAPPCEGHAVLCRDRTGTLVARRRGESADAWSEVRVRLN